MAATPVVHSLTKQRLNDKQTGVQKRHALETAVYVLVSKDGIQVREIWQAVTNQTHAHLSRNACDSLFGRCDFVNDVKDLEAHCKRPVPCVLELPINRNELEDSNPEHGW
jgi:hypothetical protein